MSGDKGRYVFVPWVRRGVGRYAANAPGTDPLAGVLPYRARLQAEVDVEGTAAPGTATASHTVGLAVDLYGPGDVAGLDTACVLRTEPSAGSVNFAPNLFAAVDLDEPGLPWMLTPAGPTAADAGPGVPARSGRLRPWLVLVALAAGEFAEVAGLPQGVRAIDVLAPGVLPDLRESWAWAHAQLTPDPSDPALDPDPADARAVAAAVEKARTTAPHLVCARLLCPRRLQPETAYAAFLVPAFDAGVQTGLGGRPADTAHADRAWDSAYAPPLRLPYYFRFPFRTSDRGDFESLVRRLQPRPRTPQEQAAFRRVGLRDMDAADPGWGVHPPATAVLGMGGALRPVGTRDAVWPDPSGPAPDPFQADLERLLGEQTAATDDPARPAEPDPVVAPSLYGRWLAAVRRVPAGGWVRDLNLDPRRRAAAGLGSAVVRGERAQLLAAAWRQVEGVLAANQVLRQAQLARGALGRMLAKHFRGAPPETVLALTAPVHARIRAGARTVRARIQASRLRPQALSAAFRRVARPLGPLRRRQGRPEAAGPYRILGRMAAGELPPSSPPRAPGGLVSMDAVTRRLYPRWAPGWLRAWPVAQMWLAAAFAGLVLFILAVLGVLLLLVVGALGGWSGPAAGLAALLVAVLLAVGRGLAGLYRVWTGAGRMRFARLTPRAVAQVPPRPAFRIVPPGQAPPAPAPGAADSAEGAAFRVALAGLAGYLHEPGPVAPLPLPLEPAGLAGEILARVDPEVSVPARAAARVRTSPSLPWRPQDPLQPIMAAPSFPQPMYEPLRDRSQDLLLPGLGAVPPETLALLQADHAFIEAYMTGLNQEMSRLLLWAGYPTDQRGTYFRQFWDVRGYVPRPGDPPPGSQQMRERLYDIPPVPSWPLSAALGENRARSGVPANSLVLLIRGELLRRFPHAVIYACPAQRTGEAGGGSPSLGLDDDPAQTLYPLYRGTLAPDLTFVGFGLTLGQARGRDPADPRGDYDPSHPDGYFFVFQEVPGEPRFGLEPPDPPPPSPLSDWGQLSWANFDDPAFAPAAVPPKNADGTPVTVAGDGSAWGTDAAQMARITMRRPARVAVLAATMLQGLPGPA